MGKWQIYFQEASDSVVDVFLHLHHFVIHVTNIEKILDTKPKTERHDILSKPLTCQESILSHSASFEPS